MIGEEEVKIVVDMVEEYNIPNNKMFLKVHGETYVFGAAGALLEEDFIKLYKYNHFFESIRDLSMKTRLAIFYAIEECKKIDANKFNPFVNKLSNEEFNCYYNLENALLRVEMLWDALAQVYNLYTESKIHINQIYYKRFFKRLKGKFSDVDEILEYIEEDLNPYETNIDKGVHKYLVNLRNTMTHKYALSVTACSFNTEDMFVLREVEALLLYKICFDYNKVMKYICNIFNIIYENQKEVVEKYTERLKDIVS